MRREAFFSPERTNTTGTAPGSTARTWLSLAVAMMVVVFTLFVLAPAPVQAASGNFDFYVSSKGNDAWSGRLAEPAADGRDGPVATLERAARLVAALRSQEPRRDRPVVVGVRGGTYFLEHAFTLRPGDSGTSRSPTVYAAVDGERPVLSGGVKISNWTAAARGRWQASLPEVRSGQWSFAQLFVGEQRRFRPRLPEHGYFHIEEGIGRRQFAFEGRDMVADWSRRSDIEVLAFHDWSASRLHIANIDTASRRVTLAGRAWTNLITGHRYVVDNVRDALLSPGQWYLDRSSGELTYIPRPGESMDTTEVVAPRLNRLLMLQGDAAGGRFVQHVVFRGLSFAHSNWVLAPQGLSMPQAEIGVDAAIVVAAARDISFEAIAVRHVGGYAIAIGAGSRDNRIEDCELVDLGAGGVKIGYAGPPSWDATKIIPEQPRLPTSHNVVRNCLIAHGGRLHPAGVAVWIGQSFANHVEHNDIFDFYQTGISVGWTWGYGPSAARDNDIGFNDVHHIGQGVMSDMGGVYTLGVQPGTVVHDNHIHGVRALRYGGWGLYADEGSSTIVFERNLVDHTGSAGFFQHFGHENIIQNNIFALAAHDQIEGTRPEQHVTFRFLHNIVYWEGGGPLIAGCHVATDPCPITFVLDGNIYWNASGEKRIFPGDLDLPQWQILHGQDRNSIVADPQFEDVANSDFTLKPSSPAIGLGFRQFGPERAGRTGDPRLTGSLPPVPPGFE
jgi:hypothetical protein